MIGQYLLTAIPYNIRAITGEVQMMISALSNLFRAHRLIGFSALLSGVIFLGIPHTGLPQSVRAREDIARILAVEKINVADGMVSGEVYNRSANTVRDVQLFVRYTWLWDNETKPGKDDPGTSTYYTLPKEIPPGGSLPFTYKPSPPPPKMAGGHFETTVTVAGFTEVIPQTR
jgi:hypothetical protein